MKQWIRPDQPTFILAPMQGVFDAPMRAVLAEVGGFHFAVSEFVRVSRQVLSAKTILQTTPEIGGKQLGRAQLPVQVQLLGSDPVLLAETALEAVVAGARAIDLNFGCPSPTVIRHEGGSSLLREPRRIQAIVTEVRRRVPAAIPVSAKIRLGWNTPDEVLPIARAALDGGADWLVIHARTRPELYRPGVHWDRVRQVADEARVPVVANGDLFTPEDFTNCRTATGCGHYMLGRGALADPLLGRRATAALSSGTRAPSEDAALLSPFNGLLAAMRRFIEIAEPLAQNSGYVPSRIKQWARLGQLIQAAHIPHSLVSALQRTQRSDEVLQVLESADLR